MKDTIVKVGKAWPVLRQMIYQTAAVVLGGLTLVGIVTDVNVTAYLGHLTTILGVVGTLVYTLSALYTPSPGGSVATPGAAPAVEVPAEATRYNSAPTPAEAVTEALSRVQEAAGPTVAQLRARIEAEARARLGK